MSSTQLFKYLHRLNICIGLYSYRHDEATNSFKQTRFSSYRAWFLNILVIVSLPWTTWCIFSQNNVENSIKANPVLIYTYTVNLFVFAMATIYTVLHRHRGELSECQYLAQLLSLEVSYKLEPQIERAFKRLLYLRGVSVAYYVLSAVINFCLAMRWTWYTYLALLLRTLAVCVLSGKTFNYFLALWLTCRGFCYANMQLSALQQRLYRQEHAAERQAVDGEPVAACDDFAVDAALAELQQLQLDHQTLRHIAQAINHLYRFQLLAIRFNAFIMITAMGYYGVVFSFGRVASMSEMAFGTLFYATMLLDSYLTDLICDSTIQAHNETTSILRQFSLLTLDDNVQLRHALDQFVLYLSSFSLRLSVCGLYDIDKSVWFEMFTTIVSYTIVLVQFHMIFQSER